ncbi:MAG: ABC transporter permease, partial [Acidobacteria bacterium]|nr:ABC transporter permease [Acidobacteriota bacterium]
RKHGVRSALTVAGIVLGVAVFVGMHTASQSVLYAFQRTVDRIAGAAQLQVSAGETGFDEEVLERVQGLPEVRVAVPVIEAVVDTGIQGQGSLFILGVDMTGDRSLRDYDLEGSDDDAINDPLIFLAQPDSLMVTKEFAARNHLTFNSRLPMRTMEGDKQFTIRGIMRSGGLASVYGGNLAVMDIYAAQKVFGRGRHFDRIDLAVKEGADVERCQAALEGLLGPGFQVEPPSGRGRQFETISRAYSLSVDISSLFALFIGMFIIYNSFAIAVTQRRPEIGILRALGATTGQIRTLFLGESAVAGLLGAAAGVGLGIPLARVMTTYISGLLENVYGIAQRAEEVTADPKIIGFALAMGAVTSIVAAWIPARNAARVDPVQALQKGKYQVLTAGENRARRRWAAVLAAVSVLCLMFGSGRFLFYAGYALAVVTALLLTPTLALWLARTLRPILKALRSVEGALAADSLMQAPRRTSATVAALMLSLAIVIAFAGVGRASYRSIVEWMDSALNPDLFVSPTESLAKRTFRLPASMTAELNQVPGIARIQPVRSARVMFRRTPVLIVATDVASLAQTVHRRPVAGDRDEMYRLTAAGQGVMVSDNFATLQGLRLGDTVELPTPTGLLRLPIAGITVDYSDQQGSILMERRVFEQWWKDDTINLYRVYLEPGAGAAEVKRRILERFSGERRLFVLSNQELRRYILTVTDQWFGLTYVQIAVGVLVAVLGIVNALTVSIMDRRRELGVLQAVGGMRRQIRHTIWMEGLTIGVIGLILGLALGAVNLHYTLQIIHRDIAGLRLGYEFPSGIALLLAPVILGAAFLAAIAPGESALRTSLVEALEYE